MNNKLTVTAAFSLRSRRRAVKRYLYNGAGVTAPLCFAGAVG